MTAFNIEKYIDSLPENIETINISDRGLTYLPSLQRFYNLQHLICNNNQLTSLPELNHTLITLTCSYNKLTYLPELNDALTELICYNNQLTSLPKLNNSLQILYCSANQLTNLPELNVSLKSFSCSNALYGTRTRGISSIRR